MNKSPFVFIASPVSSANPYEVLRRIEKGAEFAAWVQENEDKCSFSAAAHDMAVSKYLSKPKARDWWDVNIEHFMSQAESCYVLCLEGWEQSSGVALEMAAATRLGVPVVKYQVTEEGFARV